MSIKERHEFSFEDDDEMPLYIQNIAALFELKGFKPFIDKHLLFWEHHFDAFESGYPNGQIKGGTLRYKSGCVRIPANNKLLVYESEEFHLGKPPRGVVTLDYFAVFPLSLITEEELKRDGFIDMEDLEWQMTQMEDRYYADLTIDSIVGYDMFKNYNPNPSEKEVKELLKAKPI